MINIRASQFADILFKLLNVQSDLIWNIWDMLLSPFATVHMYVYVAAFKLYFLT